jgi:hypothetical protein
MNLAAYSANIYLEIFNNLVLPAFVFFFFFLGAKNMKNIKGNVLWQFVFRIFLGASFGL